MQLFGDDMCLVTKDSLQRIGALFFSGVVPRWDIIFYFELEEVDLLLFRMLNSVLDSDLLGFQ